ncbi:hypothetical protein quinque_002539 [Culex quinquefasciatus]
MYMKISSTSSEVTCLCDFQPQELYRYTIHSLKLSSEYVIAVRAKNTKNPARESELQWHTFHTPSCIDWHNSSAICAPENVANVRAEAVHLAGDNYQFNISWDKPRFVPDYYVVKLYDLNLAHLDDLEAEASSDTRNVSGELEQKAPVDPSSDFEIKVKSIKEILQPMTFPGDLIAPIEDDMEISMDQIELLDILGEGAFGLVRKGILIRPLETYQQVAVKMLKAMHCNIKVTGCECNDVNALDESQQSMAPPPLPPLANLVENQCYYSTHCNEKQRQLDDAIITSCELLEFARQVAVGMVRPNALVLECNAHRTAHIFLPTSEITGAVRAE